MDGEISPLRKESGRVWVIYQRPGTRHGRERPTHLYQSEPANYPLTFEGARYLYQQGGETFRLRRLTGTNTLDAGAFPKE